MMWGIPFGVGLALFAPAFVDHVLGSRWDEATILLQAFGLIVALRQVGFSWTVFMSAVGDTRPIAVNGVVMLITFAIITAPLMIVLGVEGYALGMAMSVVAELAVRGFYLRRLFRRFRITAHLARAILPSVPAAAAVLGLRAALDVPGSLELTLVEFALYLTVTVAATLVFERRLVAEIVSYLRRPQGHGAAAPA
jgi:O-antigen/teichoic acid export membrane protein